MNFIEIYHVIIYMSFDFAQQDYAYIKTYMCTSG